MCIKDVCCTWEARLHMVANQAWLENAGVWGDPPGLSSVHAEGAGLQTGKQPSDSRQQLEPVSLAAQSTSIV